VVPFRLNGDWSLITRTRLPAEALPPKNAGDHWTDGLSNGSTTFFLSPEHGRGFYWGAGPVLYYPATNEALGTTRYGSGPSVAFLHEDKGPWVAPTLRVAVASSVASARRGTGYLSSCHVQRRRSRFMPEPHRRKCRPQSPRRRQSQSSPSMLRGLRFTNAGRPMIADLRGSYASRSRACSSAAKLSGATIRHDTFSQAAIGAAVAWLTLRVSKP
jgi:hypothetical protein